MIYFGYRGEHGRKVPNLWAPFQTRRASLTFTENLDTAQHYARNPNDYGDFPYKPRVYTAQLSIHKAFLYTDDPFVDFEQLVHVFGKGAARPAASQFEEEIKNTNIWYDCWADKYQNPVEVFDAGENLSDLIFSTYCLLDDPAWVQKLKDSGFDGAIYGGCGESACELEYRVFSLEQVKWWERKYV